jgi:hypothetical protein
MKPVFCVNMKTLKRAIAVVVLMAFVLNDVVWAYPDLADPGRTNNSHLQVQSVMKYTPLELLIETAVMELFLSFQENIPKEQLTLTPNVKGQRVLINLDPRNMTVDRYDIPCAVSGRNFMASRDMNTGEVSVKEVPTGSAPVLGKKPPAEYRKTEEIYSQHFLDEEASQQKAREIGEKGGIPLLIASFLAITEHDVLSNMARKAFAVEIKRIADAGEIAEPDKQDILSGLYKAIFAMDSVDGESLNASEALSSVIAKVGGIYALREAIFSAYESDSANEIARTCLVMEIGAMAEKDNLDAAMVLRDILPHREWLKNEQLRENLCFCMIEFITKGGKPIFHIGADPNIASPGQRILGSVPLDILDAWVHANKDNIAEYEKFISAVSKGPEENTAQVLLSMGIKQAACRAQAKTLPGAKLASYTIPDPKNKENEQLFGRYQGFYSLEWKTFVADYDKFHLDPMNYKAAAPTTRNPIL